MARQQPTIRDVAQLAGVSIATVSRATSGGKIAPQTKLKVEKAIRTLGYQPTSSRLSMYFHSAAAQSPLFFRLKPSPTMHSFVPV